MWGFLFVVFLLFCFLGLFVFDRRLNFFPLEDVQKVQMLALYNSSMFSYWLFICIEFC